MTGEWEEKLKKIERGQLDPDAFMAGISGYIRALIEHSSARRLDPARWGSCPLCGKEVIKGKRAYGCSGWQEGCPFVLEPECKGVTLTPRQVQTLLQLRILPHPVRIDDEPRLLILSTQGQPMDLRLPSADRQKKVAKEDRPRQAPSQKEQITGGH
jgi:DNA topoisomerase-3